MRMAIGARGKLAHITGIPEPPEKNTTEYAKWEQDNLSVCSWILENMETDMVANYAEYPSAKDLWEGLAATYSQGSGGIQLYELNVKANTTRQGTESIEEFYSRLQRIWREIEARQPNPMMCTEDIGIFNRLRSETKLYQLLAGIGEEYEAERRDLLKQEPLPTPEAAYASIRRERDRRVALGVEKHPSSEATTTGGIGSGLHTSHKSEITIGSGLHTGQQSEIAHGFRINHRNQNRETLIAKRGNSGNIDRSRLRCSNCGKSRHTRDECYFIVGFPEGWTKPKQSPSPSHTTTPTATAKVIMTGNGKPGEIIGKAQTVEGMKPSVSSQNRTHRTQTGVPPANKKGKP